MSGSALIRSRWVLVMAEPMNRTHAEPTAEEVAVWLAGARTVRRAMEDFCLSRQELFAGMADGRFRWRVKDERKTRLIAVADLARYVAGLPNGRA